MRQKASSNDVKGWSAARRQLRTNDGNYQYYSLPALEEIAPGQVDKLPFSLRLLLENALRNYDERQFTKDQMDRLLAWNGKGGDKEVFFMPGRVILQDFTGVPVVADLAAMRSRYAQSGGDPVCINPVIPVDLVIDHSVMIDCFGDAQALACNVDLEYERNQERYHFLKWAQASFDRFRAFPPSAGIVHQVNLERLADVVTIAKDEDGLWLQPDTLVGTDSHTTMINGIGVMGWGVGGIEAEAAMLGQPLSFLLPDVVGMRLTGRLPERTTATDLALTVTERLRKHGVVGKFVEFFGDGIHHISVEDRATVANMSPEYGATMGYFPVDQQTIAYLRATGRDSRQIERVETYFKEQKMFLEPDAPDPVYSEVLELNLSTVQPCLAGPRRPQDRILLQNLKQSSEESLQMPVREGGFGRAASDVRKVFPLRLNHGADNGATTSLRDGSVVIAAITSCTNTSNPAVMIGAGLLAQKAVERGLHVPPYVKTSLAPGSRVVTAYLTAAGLMKPLEQLGFYIAGYGCTTCIGNSGPLIPEVAELIEKEGLNAAAVLSGNRNFEGRVHPQVKMNYLASPLLVVACALAGTVRIDFEQDPLGIDPAGKKVYLRDLWPTDQQIAEAIARFVDTGFYESCYREALDVNPRWNQMQAEGGMLYDWDPDSTYIQKPPFFETEQNDRTRQNVLSGARVLAWLGDSVTTDHISPAGNIAVDSPAGRYLQSKGIQPADFNSYGSRRGNHEVMIRGTFANIRIRNRLVEGVEGGYTRYLPDDRQMTIYEASEKYLQERIPLLILAGREYGSGSSRDWAAKGAALLGVKVVIAVSYERIHRSNLVGMGILPLEFMQGENAGSIGLNGTEIYSIAVDRTELKPGGVLQVMAVADDGTRTFDTRLRIDSEVEMDTWYNGGILPLVLRQFDNDPDIRQKG